MCGPSTEGGSREVCPAPTHSYGLVLLLTCIEITWKLYLAFDNHENTHSGDNKLLDNTLWSIPLDLLSHGTIVGGELLNNAQHAKWHANQTSPFLRQNHLIQVDSPSIAATNKGWYAQDCSAFLSESNATAFVLDEAPYSFFIHMSRFTCCAWEPQLIKKKLSILMFSLAS